MRIIKTKKGELNLKDEIEAIFEKKVTKFGTGAKVDCPLQFLGKNVYILVRKKD
jgi:putative transposon-encoded protein